jgi:hypothetical protein
MSFFPQQTTRTNAWNGKIAPSCTRSACSSTFFFLGAFFSLHESSQKLREVEVIADNLYLSQFLG